MKQYTPNLFFNKYFNVSDIIEPDFHSLYHSRGLYTPLPVNGSHVLLVNNYTFLSSWWHLSLWLALAHEIWVIKLYAIVMFYVKLEQKISLELHSSTHPPLSLHHKIHVLFRLNLGMETIWHNLELNWIKAHFWSSIYNVNKKYVISMHFNFRVVCSVKGRWWVWAMLLQLY